jgi:hypothetical protein
MLGIGVRTLFNKLQEAAPAIAGVATAAADNPVVPTAHGGIAS